MNEGSTTFSPLVVKPLLLEALGKPFLAYVLGATEEEIEQRLISTNDEFGTPQQTHALSQLHIVLHHAQENGEPEFRRLNLSRILGIYHEPLQTTLVNVVRGIATNEVPAPAESDSLSDILTKLVRDIYPLYLLPEDTALVASSPASLYQHPLRVRFESAVMNDDLLAPLFPKEDEHSGRHGSSLRSTGQGGGVQLIMFAETLIGAGWRAARITNPVDPSLDEHVSATLGQLSIIRDALAGKAVEVPVRVAFTGVRLTSERPLDLGWGVLRAADNRDYPLIPKSIEGQLSGVGADGNEVAINYSGDVILETSINYRISRQEINLGEGGWPKELREYERVEQLVENIQLGALLSCEYNTTEPITVLPTWRYLHDPLVQAFSYNVGWNDPRMSRNFIPKQLNEEDAEAWKEFTISVEQNRTKHVDVAIRRTLRASAERRDLVDALVDAVIAWENLVGSQKGEPTLRVSASLAWLLEDDVAKRTALRSELAKLYHLRSQVVHGNEPPSTQELAQKSQRAVELTVAALRILFTTRLDLLKECKNGDDRSNKLLMGG